VRGGGTAADRGLTACVGIRKDRPTRIASRSPDRTRRYTVCFDTRKIVAASKMVRNRALFGGAALPVTVLLEVWIDAKVKRTGPFPQVPG
jgi:hypothetical protein